jgi:N5-(cytidine 5'-diphosphoramidyl)-L-glutamine hydrolase
MKRIVVTQRVEVVHGGAERRDCLDQNWVEILQTFDAIPIPLPNTLHDPVQFIQSLGIDGVVLSGGNDLAQAPDAADVAPERDETERAVASYCIESGVPLLGVCRGLQAINVFLGGRMMHVTRHAGTRHVVRRHGGVEGDWPTVFEVNSFHKHGISQDGLAPDLDAVVMCEQDGTVEAVRHRRAKCMGVMWHPEREKPTAEHDIVLLRRLFAP